MKEREDLPPMKPVNADDARPETRLWQWARRLLVSIGTFVVVWAGLFVAVRVLHVPVWVAVSVGVVITLAALAVDIVRRRR